jgi:hypothetical protein
LGRGRHAEAREGSADKVIHFGEIAALRSIDFVLAEIQDL